MLNFKCPHCNDSISVDEKFAGKTGNCKRCHKPLTVPELQPVPRPSPSFTQAPPPVLPSLQKTASNKPAPVICKVCDNGILTHKKVYRLSGCAITIGYIFLIPSILGMVMGVFLLLTAGAATTQVGEIQNSEYRSALTNAGVSGPLLKKLLEGGSLDDNDRQNLTNEQISDIELAQFAKIGGNIGAGAATGIAGGAALFIIISSFCSGLLGFLLTMKKRILQCNACQAVVSAS